MTRRQPGDLTPLEAAILLAIMRLTAMGKIWVYAHQIRQAIAEEGGIVKYSGFSSLYRALERMAAIPEQPLLLEMYEEPDLALLERRPRRRYYSITAAGRAAYEQARRVPTQMGAIKTAHGGILS